VVKEVLERCGEFNHLMNASTNTKRISLREAAREPFRFFFPQAVLAGIFGVLLWPFYFLHSGQVAWFKSSWEPLRNFVDYYPNLAHVRVMVFGFFGGFIFGFLGTALPRMLSAPPFRLAETIVLLLLHAAMTIAYFRAQLFAGDLLLLLLLARLVIAALTRLGHRKDIPPPGFVLVGLAFLCVALGAVLSIAQKYYSFEGCEQWISFQRLLSSQGFVLLPILGIGPFILPRFFGRTSPHDFPEMLKPSPDWTRKALVALGVGFAIILTFLLEAFGWFRLGHALRFAVTLIYLIMEFPFRSAPQATNALGLSLRIALAALLGGFISVAVFPEYRTGLLHLTLVGGFAIITFVVATRVVFGHSGNIEKLKGRNRWLLWLVALMLFAMATRISGDVKGWERIRDSHYIYGALLWAITAAWWALKVLPKVREREPE
jgi:uncharacterized protein involved in response to NO